MFLSQIICVCHRQSLSVIDILCPSQTVFVCYRHSLSITDFLFILSQTVCICYRQSLSVTKNCVCHRQYLSVTNSICLSQTVCVCPRHFFFTYSLCLSQKVFCPFVCVFIKHFSWSFLAWCLLIYTWFPSIFVREILVCLGIWNWKNQLCGSLAGIYSEI